MGPHFFKCGSRVDLYRGLPSDPGFNGAALFQVRKFGYAMWYTIRGIGFNGAALFQVRKFLPRSQMKNTRVLLQWGRTFSSAEVNLQ